MAQTWYDRWPARLQAEVQVMAERFPNFSLQQRANGTLAWIGAVVPVPGYEFVLRVQYPPHYPYQQPLLYVEWPPLKPTPNRLADGGLCITRIRWDQARGTAASMVPLAVSWLVVYLERTLPVGAQP